MSNIKRSHSAGQMAVRTQFANAMFCSRIMAKIIPGGFEFKPPSLTYANLFAKLNLNKVCVYLNKFEAEIKASVAGEYLITQGSESTIDFTLDGDVLVTSLSVPAGFVITDTTTMGEVSAALIAANDRIHLGSSLSIVYMRQDHFKMGTVLVPKAELVLYRINMNGENNTLFRSRIPQEVFDIRDNKVATGVNLKEGVITYVHSSKKNKKVSVSTQILTFTPNNVTGRHYTSAEKKAEAIASYGADKMFYYDPDMVEDDAPLPTPVDPTDPTDPTVFAITAVKKNDVLVPQASGAVTLSSGNVLKIVGTKLLSVPLKVRLLDDPTGDPHNVNLSSLGTLTQTDKLTTINVTLGWAEVYCLVNADTSAVVYSFE